MTRRREDMHDATKGPLRALLWQPLAALYSVFVGWVWSINEACRPFFVKQLLNGLAVQRVDTHDQTGAPYVWSSVFEMLAIWTFMVVMYRLHCWWLALYLPRLKGKARQACMAMALQGSGPNDKRVMHGKVASYLVDFPQSIEAIYRLLALQIVPIASACVVATVLMAQAGFVYAFTFILWLSLHLMLFKLYRPRSLLASSKAAQAAASLQGEMMDTLQNRAAVAAHRREACELVRLRQLDHVACEHEQFASRRSEHMKLWQGLNALVFIYVIVVSSVNACATGHLSLGMMYQILGSCFTMVGLAWYSGQHMADLVREFGKVQQALKLFEHRTPAARLITTPRLVRDGRGRAIALREVRFAYPNDREVLEGVTFEMVPGEKVALLGPSGCGKSTLLRLLVGELEARSGSVHLMGQRVTPGAANAVWLDNISLVSQEPCLFHRSIADNIRYGRPDATDREVIEAAYLAQAHAFIEALPNRYNALVGERGACLSAGQKQRIAMARAILRDAPLWILDEPTSALDADTEADIIAAWKPLFAKKTVLITTHRPALLAIMTRKIYFHSGKIYEQPLNDTDNSRNSHTHVRTLA